MVESNRAEKTGEMSSVGELKVDGATLKKVRNFKIVELAIGGVPKTPFYVNSEVRCTIPIAPYTTIGVTIGISAPIDITKITIPEAYEDMKHIVLNELNSLADKLTEGILAKESDSGKL